MALNKLIFGLGAIALASTAFAGPHSHHKPYKHRDNHNAATVSSAHDVPAEAYHAGIPHLNYATKGDPLIRKTLRDSEHLRMEKSEAYLQAYEDGVADHLEDFRGRMNAREGFIWEPPVVEYVAMPAMVRNGALYPSHKQPVVVSPGRWVEANSVMLPDDPMRRKTGRIQYVK